MTWKEGGDGSKSAFGLLITLRDRESDTTYHYGLVM